MKRLLIDGDVLRYRYGFACQKKDKATGTLIVDTEENLYWALHRGIHYMLKATEADSYTIYLSGKDNFRLRVDPEYKANRKDAEKPYYFHTISGFLEACMGAEVVDGVEADDILAIECLKDPDNNIIGTIDKDLDQIPGWHYNFVKDNLYYVIPAQAEFNLWMQMLTGDATDNIMGCGEKIEKIYGPTAKKAGEKYMTRVGIGPVEAEKALENCETSANMKAVVEGLYHKKFGAHAQDKFNMNMTLLRMLRTDEERQLYTTTNRSYTRTT